MDIVAFLPLPWRETAEVEHQKPWSIFLQWESRQIITDGSADTCKMIRIGMQWLSLVANNYFYSFLWGYLFNVFAAWWEWRLLTRQKSTEKKKICFKKGVTQLNSRKTVTDISVLERFEKGHFSTALVVMRIKACTYADMTGLWTWYWKPLAPPWIPLRPCTNIVLHKLRRVFFCALMSLMCFGTSQPTAVMLWWKMSVEVLILEVSYTFNHSLVAAFLAKVSAATEGHFWAGLQI